MTSSEMAMYGMRGSRAKREGLERVLLKCWCGGMYETYYAHPADECPNCRKDHNKRLHRERLEPNKGAKWVVLSDPCDAPMFEGRRLSSQEVARGGWNSVRLSLACGCHSRARTSR